MNLCGRSSTHGGKVQKLVLNAPPGNIITIEMLDDLKQQLDEITQLDQKQPIHLILFEGAGSHFSFGASVEQHLPGKVDLLITKFHDFIRALEATSIPTATLVRGHCLGGAFELALWTGWIFCDDTSQFGLPEMKLGVFPPLATIALPWRTSHQHTMDLILSGAMCLGSEALELGLVCRRGYNIQSIFDAWFHSTIATKSIVALRHAWRATRQTLVQSLNYDLPRIEQLYLNELMKHKDPIEGLTAFLEKRPPVWSHS